MPASLERAYNLGLIQRRFIVVFPNGDNDSFWADSWNGSRPIETNVVRELIPYVDSRFRTISQRGNRVIQGFSMGGLGAAKFMTKFPELFSIGVIYDGALLSWSTLRQRHPNIAREMFNNDSVYFSHYSPWRFAATNASTLRTSVAVRMIVGTIVGDNRRFRDTLFSHGIPVDYVETTCGHNLGCLLDTAGLNSAVFIANRLEHVTSAGEQTENRPGSVSLHQNLTNPFNLTTTIRFFLPVSEHATLKVFDLLGREVQTLASGVISPGEHRVLFHAENLPSGVYFYRLTTASFIQTRKAVLMK